MPAQAFARASADRCRRLRHVHPGRCRKQCETSSSWTTSHSSRRRALTRSLPAIRSRTRQLARPFRIRTRAARPRPDRGQPSRRWPCRRRLCRRDRSPRHGHGPRYGAPQVTYQREPGIAQRPRAHGRAILSRVGGGPAPWLVAIIALGSRLGGVVGTSGAVAAPASTPAPSGGRKASSRGHRRRLRQLRTTESLDPRRSASASPVPYLGAGPAPNAAVLSGHRSSRPDACREHVPGFPELDIGAERPRSWTSTQFTASRLSRRPGLIPGICPFPIFRDGHG